MPKQITSLTPEQEAQLEPWAQKWIKIGLSTERADWDRFSAAALACYRFADLDPNVPIIRVASPVVGAVAAIVADRAFADLGAKKGPIRIDNEPVHHAADDAAAEALVRGGHGLLRMDQIKSAIAAARKAVAKDRLYWHRWMGGSLWGYWVSMESFFREVCGLELEGDLSDRAKALAEITQSACYWWPNEHFIMVCDRPTAIHLDDNNRLHNESGKAIEWIDGWGLYSLEGVTLTEAQAVGEVTVDMIKSETNAEIRRLLAQRYGMDRYLRDTGAKEIHRDQNRVLVQDMDKRRWMVCTDGSTGRVYQIRVPESAQTCREAHEAISGLRESDCVVQC